MHEGVEVAAVRGHVAEPVARRAHLAVTEPAQVRHDHLEAGGGQRTDDLPPHSLRLGPAVDEDEGAGAADPLVREDLLEASDRCAPEPVPARVDVGGVAHRITT